MENIVIAVHAHFPSSLYLFFFLSAIFLLFFFFFPELRLSVSLLLLPFSTHHHHDHPTTTTVTGLAAQLTRGAILFYCALCVYVCVGERVFVCLSGSGLIRRQCYPTRQTCVTLTCSQAAYALTEKHNKVHIIYSNTYILTYTVLICTTLLYWMPLMLFMWRCVCVYKCYISERLIILILLSALVDESPLIWVWRLFVYVLLYFSAWKRLS